MVKEIFVKSQGELDNISTEDDVIINVCFGIKAEPAIIYKRYKYLVRACRNSSVRVCNNCLIKACDNSLVEALSTSSVIAYNNSLVMAYDCSSVEAGGNSLVIAYNNSLVRAGHNSSVVAYGNSLVEAFGNSSVEAYGNSSVEVHDRSSVMACGNAQVLKMDNHQNHIRIFGNARIVYTPKNIIDFMEYHNINYDNDTAIFYKAVHKKVIANHIEYLSNFDSNFTYEIGKKQSVDFCNRDPKEECAEGIHISTKHFALRFGMNWGDLAILEVKAKIKDIILPDSSDGKIRVPEVEVIREVPLEECGILGKIFLKRNGMKEGAQNE